MDGNHAEQIATLLNAQNQLTVQYTASRVLEHQDDYLVRLDDAGQVVACAELKQVQWYQFELLHVTVAQQSQKQVMLVHWWPRLRSERSSAVHAYFKALFVQVIQPVSSCSNRQALNLYPVSITSKARIL